MINKDFLQKINDFDDKKEKLNYAELIDNLELLETVNSQINKILMTTRIKKLMKEFGERETDIYVVTYAKSGTTLMQMLLYQLTTDGNMNFNHIYDVSPWAGFYAYYKKEMPSVGERRIIKSHDHYDMLENVRKGKFIFVIRDGLDVIVSLYQHLKDYNNLSEDFLEFSSKRMQKWSAYVTEWLQNKNGLEILYLNYEDLVKDKVKVIERIAKFTNVRLDEQIMNRALERTSLEFMKANEAKFGEQPEDWKVYNNFIRNGRVGEGKHKFTKDQLIEYKSLSKEFLERNEYTARYFE